MCGVSGIYRPKNPELIRRMNARLIHRGPDGEGVYAGREMALGSRRLRILDLSPNGDMPFSSACGRYHLVYNGEIYNHAELRRRVADYPFRSSTDTEVLFALLQREGAAALPHLNGMFSFLFWDEQEHTLLVARDRLGIKPLFFAEHAGSFYFASEIAALLEEPELGRGLDEQALYHYLSLLHFPEPYTIYPRIRHFPAAHVGLLREGQFKLQRYWDLRFDKALRTEAEWEEAVRSAFHTSVRRQLVADVPLGVLLSGGLDSTAIAATMAGQGSGTIEAFSMGFQDGADETAAASETARRLGCRHHLLHLDGAALWRDIPAITAAFSQPFAGGLPMYFLCRDVAQHVTVALSGTGGDELFGNYGRIRNLRPGRGALAGLKTGLRLFGPRLLSHLGGERGRYLLRHGAPLGHLHHEKNYPVREWRKRRLLLRPPAQRTDLLLEDRFWRLQGLELEDRLFALELETQLKDEFLMSHDLLSIAHHLEVRVPWLDHELVELLARAPHALRSIPEDPKAWMRRIFKAELPAHILASPKSGFMIPYGHWIRGPLRSVAAELLAKPRLDSQGLFDSREAQRYYTEHLAGADHSYLLWSLLMFQIWFSQREKLPLPGFAAAS